MINEIITQLTPILITAIMGMLVIIIKNLGDVLKEYVEAKRDEVIEKIGAEKYNSMIVIGRNIWGIVEEEFRLSDTIGTVMEDKIALFNKLLRDKIPEISQEDVEFVRQTIAGQVNSFKDLTEPVPEIITIE